MAEIYEPLQLRDEYGHPTGRYRVCCYSDEDRRILAELCSCPDGHESPEAARKCPEAVKALGVAVPRIERCPHCNGTGIFVPRGG